MNEKIISRSENGIGWIIFNNVEKRNAVSLAMAKRVAEVIKEFEENKGGKVNRDYGRARPYPPAPQPR